MLIMKVAIPIQKRKKDVSERIARIRDSFAIGQLKMGPEPTPKPWDDEYDKTKGPKPWDDEYDKTKGPKPLPDEPRE
jgi:hypothetical protein